ncbi:MAG TPA: polymer-forming cytoskeletal protein [Giesbergeria sp.]|nr:polymer-forming cytoskeletal protein [Giesbergeria sp.]
MAVQNPFFGKREPETFQPRQPTIAQGSANGLNPAGNTSQTSSAAVVNTKAPVESTGSKLTVGPNIKLKGVEITDCDTLVVEGTVEATMDSRVIQISEQGAFRGSADIDIAEIRGDFNGTLTVRQKLVIYSTGKVSGKIRYGKLVIEEGGQISGEIDVGTASSAPRSTGARSPEAVAIAA